MPDREQSFSQSASVSARAARLVQITDCHLGPTDEYCLAGIRTFHSFREVLDRLLLDGEQPDLTMVTGDISAHGTEQAYLRFTRAMDERGLPYAWLPGNHDDFIMMLEGLSVSPYCPILEQGNWRLISLNTAVPGRVEGRLSDAELEFLRRSLDTERGQHVALFMHHPPTEIGCRWLDRQRVANGEALGELVSGYKNIRAIFTGHVHQQATADFHGIPLHTTPSTCFQFTPLQKHFAVDILPPGYRWINLYENGEIETGVVWIEDTAEVVDTNVEGY